MNRMSSGIMSTLLAIGGTVLFVACDVPPATDTPASTGTDPGQVVRQIEEAERTGSPKPSVNKSVVTSKEGESGVTATAETSLGRYVRKDGEWVAENPEYSAIFRGSCTSCTSTMDTWITDIKLVAGSTSGVACPLGYSKLDVDLNRRAGGKWIFLCYQYGPASSAIAAWTVKTTGRTAAHPEQYLIKGVNGSNGDMNQGAGGRYVYGTWGATGGTCRLKGLAVVTDSLGKVHPPLPFLSPFDPNYDVDLNDEAGGDFIYIGVLPEPGCSW
jgi:hypothetical protein